MARSCQRQDKLEENKEAKQMGSINCALHYMIYIVSHSVVDVVEFDS